MIEKFFEIGVVLFVWAKTLGQKVSPSKQRFVQATLLCYAMDGTSIASLTGASKTHRHLVSVKDLLDHLTEPEEEHVRRVIAHNVLSRNQRIERWFRNRNTEELRKYGLFITNR